MADSWRPGQDAASRTAQAVQTMVPGSVKGRLRQARITPNPERDQRGAGETIEATFSYPGTPDPTIVSPPYLNRSAGALMGTIIVATASVPTAASTVSVRVNGTQVAAVTLPAGTRPYAEAVVNDVTLAYGDQITVQATAVGAGLSGLTVQCLLEGEET